ncbi:glycerol kinase GlpK [Umboniibacter marinipuniceus]|uniref:glycerol kinase n=1 Tax=Umboniibacter marinipuniceus TaxID=569599 RepID=A0A3M0A539_9GAMM|nr:glycerol kinase GlpK [Umboniibacter marinipuniceus]RMA79484.1 glycerol kinase [Umboniibacter marinipuniceus]
MNFILSIDQGTTSSRAIIFDEDFSEVASHQQEFQQYFPKNGWVEHDALEIWESVLVAVRKALSSAQLSAKEIKAIGITNQRETVVAWQKSTGKPIAPAIVWQDRRTEDFCRQLRQRELGEMINSKTGLVLDPYFSASKIQWLLENTSGARQLIAEEDLLVGTIDTWLIWKLTGGAKHTTDATNASRTQLFNIRQQCWDDELLALFNIPKRILPAVHDCAADFGETVATLFGDRIAIRGVAGDQQAALIGQRCWQPGDIKSTYGTGCFVMANTGSDIIVSEHKLLSTVAYRLDGRTHYAIEGSIFMAGAIIQWLRDSLGIISSASETERLAADVEVDHGVIMVPAFTGLGAPHWAADARASISGMTRGTDKRHIASASLQSVAFQSADLFAAMESDGVELTQLKVDGGMVKNSLFCQWLADFSKLRIVRNDFSEATALGAAYLAALGSGLAQDLNSLPNPAPHSESFSPRINPSLRDQLMKRWHAAVSIELSRNDRM